MNKKFILISAASLAILTWSCDPLEPDTYSQQIYRIATVQYTDGKASMAFDYPSDSYILSNFKTAADMSRFNVSHGDRVIADLTMTATGNIIDGEQTLNRIYPFKRLNLEQSKPSDTLNFDYQFSVLELPGIQYPELWAHGHLITIAPTFYTRQNQTKAEFKLYPLDFKGDTLFLRLYANIPGSNMSIHNNTPEQELLSFDISSLRETVPDPAENSHRQQMLHIMDSLALENIVVDIITPDTLRGTMTSATATSVYYKYYSSHVTTSISFDF